MSDKRGEGTNNVLQCSDTYIGMRFRVALGRGSPKVVSGLIVAVVGAP